MQRYMVYRSISHAIAANSNYVFVGHPSNNISILDHRLNQRTTQSINSNYLSYSWGMSINPAGMIGS